MRCFRKLLGISYRDHITNDAVRDRIRQAIGPYDDILTTVKKRKLKWFGHVSRSSGHQDSARREKKGPTKEALGEQHRWMDRVEVLRCRKRSWQQNKMEGEGCNVCGAPTVIDYRISASVHAGLRDEPKNCLWQLDSVGSLLLVPVVCERGGRVRENPGKKVVFVWEATLLT